MEARGTRIFFPEEDGGQSLVARKTSAPFFLPIRYEEDGYAADPAKWAAELRGENFPALEPTEIYRLKNPFLAAKSKSLERMGSTSEVRGGYARPGERSTVPRFFRNVIRRALQESIYEEYPRLKRPRFQISEALEWADALVDEHFHFTDT